MLIYLHASGWRASDSLLATVPPSILITPNRPDIAIRRKESNAVELTCPLESIHHLELARDRKLTAKEEYTNYFYLN